MKMSQHEIDVKFNLFRVSELQQERVSRLLKAVREDNFRMWCFGSSVTGNCTPFSDLDLCVETKVYDDAEFMRIFDKLCAYYFNRYYDNNSIDIIYYNELTSSDIVMEAVRDHGVLLKDFRETYV